LKGSGGFVFVTICRNSARIKLRQVVYFQRNAPTTRPFENEREEPFLFPRRYRSTVLVVVCAGRGGL
jgi:hypothetical protein